MSIRGAVMGSRYYALDSDAAADGQAGSAHWLRAIAMSANRLLCTGEPVVTLVWDATTGASESPGQGMMRGYGVTNLVRVAGPIIVKKKPGLRKVEVNVTALINSTNTCDFLMTTRAAKFRPDLSNHPGSIVMTGNGTTDFQHFAATGIPCEADEDEEQLSFYMLGRPTTTLAASGDNSGTVDAAWESEFIDASSTFHSSLPFAHEVEFQNSSSVAFTARRLITERTVNFGGIQGLKFWPPLSETDVQRARGALFKIYQLPSWRLGCINVNTEDREA